MRIARRLPSWQCRAPNDERQRPSAWVRRHSRIHRMRAGRLRAFVPPTPGPPRTPDGILRTDLMVTNLDAKRTEDQSETLHFFGPADYVKPHRRAGAWREERHGGDRRYTRAAGWKPVKSARAPDRTQTM